MRNYLLPLAFVASVVFSSAHAASAADPGAPLIVKIATAAQKDRQTEFKAIYDVMIRASKKY